MITRIKNGRVILRDGIADTYVYLADGLISAVTQEELDAGTEEVTFLIPFSNYGLINRLHSMGSVLKQEYVEDGVTITLRMEKQNVDFVCREGGKLLDGEA